jgi:hypothetical protein
MKRAKIAISALAVLAVAGGSLAFRAHHFSNKYLYIAPTTTTTVSVTCTLVSTVTTTRSGFGTLKITEAAVSTDPTTTLCIPSHTGFVKTISGDE